jgi:hypothetical protein
MLSLPTCPPFVSEEMAAATLSFELHTPSAAASVQEDENNQMFVRSRKISLD